MLSAFQHLIEEPPAGYLGEAVREALRGVGRTSPNPAVGAIVVKDHKVIGRGFHARAGDRHAEVVALDDVNAKLGAGAAAGSVVYVTLEPCGHHGRTPPCVDRLIAERVARVVVGSVDPNPQMNGQSLQKLRAHGIDVEVAGGEDALWSQALLRPFASSVLRQRPHVIIKVATSLDGKVATRTGSSRWITGKESRRLVHRLRDACDAVATGAGTVIADNPALTVREVAGRDPLRVVFDRRHRAAKDAAVFADAHHVVVDSAAVADAMPLLHQRHVASLLVEAGPALATAFLQAGLVDEVWWFHAPVVVGSDGVSVFASLAVDDVNAAVAFDPIAGVDCGRDRLTVLCRRR